MIEYLEIIHCNFLLFIFRNIYLEMNYIFFMIYIFICICVHESHNDEMHIIQYKCKNKNHLQKMFRKEELQ